MKLNKFFFGLLMTPAVVMVGCSDYEDTEVVSPEANADAIGAYFAKNANSVTLSPGETSFDVDLQRASFTEAANVPVTITDNKDNFFSLSANQFVFDAEKQTSNPVTVTFDLSKVELQKEYSLGLQVSNGVKDHLYGVGYTDTEYSFVVDYDWEALTTTMVKDEYAGTFEGEGTLASVEIANDFEVDAETDSSDDTKNSLVRIPSFFASIGKTKTSGDDHVQFVVDKNHENPQFLTTTYLAGKQIQLIVETTKLKTGMTEEIGETTYPVCMDLQSITVLSKTTAATDDVTYQFTYALYVYDESTEKQYKVSDGSEGTETYKAQFEVKFAKPSAE